MKRIVLLLLPLATLMAAWEAQAVEILPGVEKNINFHVGARALDQEDWTPVDSQGAFSVELDFRPESWPVSFLVGLTISSDKRSEVVISDDIPISADLEASMAEMDIGVRKYLNFSPWFSIFLDAGTMVFSADVTIGSQWTNSQTSSDSAIGFYYGGGALARLGMVNLGLCARMMNGEKVTLFGDPFKSDYFQVTLVIGWSY